MIRYDQKTEAFKRYESASLKFCESLIKDKSEAAKMVNEIFDQIREQPPVGKPDLNFESHLFICLRTTVFNYLKTAHKNDLLPQPTLEKKR